MESKTGKRGRVTRSIPIALTTIGAAAALMVTSRAVIALFGPGLPYRLPQPPEAPLDSEEFRRFLSIITDSAVHPKTQVSVLTNGDQFYAAELEAMRQAKSTINLEAYEFLEGELTNTVLDTLAERARARVEVRVVIDAVGSMSTKDSYFSRLRQAGGRMCWYHPLRAVNWPRYNNRTHRKLTVVDGSIAFVGGADFADHWIRATKDGPRWRDTVFRLEGEAVGAVQSVFAENWLESSGDILSGGVQFPFREVHGNAMAMVVNSAPSGGCTRSRILFQALLELARESIRITTPYFLPDRSAREAIARAAQRGVKVQIITAGKYSDHPLARKLSRSMDRKLLQAGVEIFEYEAAMIHAKIMNVDGCWSVIGSTNFDHRSFALNDEVNVAIFDRELVERIEQDFEEDVRHSQQLDRQDWRARSVAERAEDALARILIREE
ncbi:MAG TPA: phospholipase D-like domain-containing protein [Terriglobales bacterium]|nr:phospholipase D-like domain-containing protein [Terriglobales bacterium]